MKKSNNINKALMMSTAVALLANPAIAQESDEQDSGDKLEVIMVTAQKRSESTNSIGVSVTAFSGDQIEKMGIEQSVDIARQTPGLSTANGTSGGTPLFSIRGIGLDDFNANNSSGVGVYIDEVYAGFPAFLNGQLMDVSRVEVLKGPQGTLYGKNATGGAINFISRKPTEDLEGYLTAGYSRWDTVEAKGAVSGALSDTVRGRVAATYTKQDEGWQEDMDTGEELGLTDRFAVRTLFEIDLTDDVYGLLNVHYSKDQSTSPSPHSEDSEDIADLFYGVIPGVKDYFGMVVEGQLDTPRDPTKVRTGGLDLERDEEGVGASFRLDASFETFDLTSITAWDNYSTVAIDNLDGMQGANLDMYRDNEVEQVYQELRITFEEGDVFTWLAGISYSHEEIENNDGFDITQVVNAVDVLDIGGTVITNDYVQTTDSFGAFLHTETLLTDELKLTVGGRYSTDDREFDGRSVPSGEFLLPGATQKDSQNENDFSWRLGLDYQINEDTLLYSSIATGYKGGLYYGTPAVEQDVWGYSKPEEVTSYEVGAKLTLLDDRMQLNAVAFHTDYDNRQSLVLVEAVTGLVSTMANIPESEINGAEVELTWQITRGLIARAGVGYLDSEVTETITNVRGLELFAPIPVGEKLSLAPEWSYNALVSYETPLSNNLVARASVNYSHVSEQSATLADVNAIYGTQESLGFRLTLAQADDKWDISLWGKNMTDEESETYSYSNLFGGRSYYLQQPMSYGVEFTRRWN